MSRVDAGKLAHAIVRALGVDVKVVDKREFMTMEMCRLGGELSGTYVWIEEEEEDGQ